MVQCQTGANRPTLVLIDVAVGTDILRCAHRLEVPVSVEPCALPDPTPRRFIDGPFLGERFALAVTSPMTGGIAHGLAFDPPPPRGVLRRGLGGCAASAKTRSLHDGSIPPLACPVGLIPHHISRPPPLGR